MKISKTAAIMEIEIAVDQARLKSMRHGKERIETKILKQTYAKQDLETAQKTLAMLDEQIKTTENHLVKTIRHYHQLCEKLPPPQANARMIQSLQN